MIYYDSKSKLYKSSFIPREHGFGTKQFGDGRDSNMLYFKNIVIPHQTHSTNIKIFKKRMNEMISHIDDCDGIVTNVSITLTVLTADCVPIIYYDKKNHISAISHQGWKGTVHGLPGKIIASMIKQGAQVEHIYCAFGPAINECCYNIFGDRLKQFKTAIGHEVYSRIRGTYYLSLYKANRQTLLESGLIAKNIDIFPFCTSCNVEKFYSLHRDGSINGEMLSYISA